ncbi:ABC transporter ATP-binding protein [Latilactobacillus sakei]|uniref:ABC transporter ATP-binding protein n=1 Tax=Latilactobacillus sakei TaxID=1599 RepID=UPI0039B0E6BD
MKLMWRYTIRYKKLLFWNFICVFGFILIELGLPTLLGQIIDKGINRHTVGPVWQYGTLMVVISLIGLVGLIGLAYTGSRLTTNLTRDIRNDIFKKTMQFSHHEYGEFGVSSLITRTTNDAFQVTQFMVQVLRTGFMTPMMIVASAFMIVRTSLSLSWIVFAAIPILLVGVVIIGWLSEPMSAEQQKNLDAINLNLRENLTGIRVIRAFVREKFQSMRFRKVNEAYSQSSIKLFTLVALAQPGFSFIFNIVFVLIIWQGAVQINTGHLAVGTLIAFIEYIFHVLFSFMLFASVFMMYPRAAVSAERIEKVLNSPVDITDDDQGIQTTTTQGELAFENVSFAYPGPTESPVIRDVSFKAHPGETVAFIGSTGSGKSTLIQLIPRFFDVTRGQVMIDGYDVRDYQLKALRQKIGFIPQKAVLFTGTIADNLRYGNPEATDAELWDALTIAQSKTFVAEKPEGLQTYLAEGGNNLSGGQKQRLAIARAIVRRPDIYVFDDSFSALDYQTDAALRGALKSITKDATVLIVAQRVGTIMNADRIVVLNEGQVVGIGTHKKLLKTNEVYRAIAASQLSKEELNEEY